MVLMNANSISQILFLRVCSVKLVHIKFCNRYYNFVIYIKYMKASEPKWVNSIYTLYGVNSLRLGGLNILLKNVSRIIFTNLHNLLNAKKI